jgi:hypothetical protein
VAFASSICVGIGDDPFTRGAVFKQYWGLPEGSTLRDVVLVVRADDAHHRDVNHAFASELAGLPVKPTKIAPSPYHRILMGKAA